MTSLINNLGGAIGFGENYLTRNDDSYQSNVSLTSIFGSPGLNFFGTNYSYISINNNGNVTLSNTGYGLSAYTPFGLANGGYAIIAPFFADVDTRLSGGGGSAAANQVTPTAGGTSRGSDLVWYDINTSGYGTLTVTWDDVGYYSYGTAKLNAFQLQIVGVDNKGNFDIIFRYESINWTTGNASGGSSGLGGTVARAGYSTGDGSSWYELAQSGFQDSMLALESTAGNTGVSGYYKFSVRSGSAAGETMNGTANDDLLAGAGGNDTLNGFAGNDYLTGNSGSDRMLGGLGNDTYTTDGLDTIVELANQGRDTVMSNVTYTLGANLEDLMLTGSSYINGTGNGLANCFTGNSGNNVLNGMAGNDTVDYSLTNYYGVTIDLSLSTAQYNSYQGSDTLISIENVIGSIYGDRLTGTNGTNVIDGNLGADTMVGGNGSDTYYVDNVGDVVTETNATASTGGTDSVYSSLASYTLASNVEIGRIGITTASLTGNTLNNSLYGSSGKNTLNGAAGADLLAGGAGNDILTGGTGNDSFLFNTTPNATSNKDTITDFGAISTNNDRILLDGDIFTALGGAAVTTNTALTASMFRLGAAALDANDHIIYNRTTGALIYDSNGSAAGGAVQIALIGTTTHAVLGAGDFFITA